MRNNSVDQAVDYRDGMAKVYHVLFVIFLNFTLPLTGWVFLVVLSVKLCWCTFPPKLNPNSSELQLLFFLQALYGNLFIWIVHRINALLRIDQRRLTSYV